MRNYNRTTDLKTPVVAKTMQFSVMYKILAHARLYGVHLLGAGG